jgi:hypothetical protein
MVDGTVSHHLEPFRKVLDAPIQDVLHAASSDENGRGASVGRWGPGRLFEEALHLSDSIDVEKFRNSSAEELISGIEGPCSPIRSGTPRTY